MSTIRYSGVSTDYLTNRWSVTCDCGKSFEPGTTLRSKQSFSCPKCGAEYYADYNADPVLLKKTKEGIPLKVKKTKEQQNEN
jgi:transposase